MNRQQCSKAWCETAPWHGCRYGHDEHATFSWGRCKSGRRWFWSVVKWPNLGGLDEWPRWHGWTDTEEAAKQLAYAKIKEVAGERRILCHTTHHSASSTLREVNQEKRKQRMAANPSKATGVSNHGTLWFHPGYSDDGHDYGWHERRIIKRTKKHVWVESRWQREDDSLIRLDREKLEREGCAWSRSAREYFYTDARRKADELEGLRHRADWLKKRFRPLPEMPENFTKEDVAKAFREGSLVHHPDQGGDPEMFRKLVKAKERALEARTEIDARRAEARARRERAEARS